MTTANVIFDHPPEEAINVTDSTQSFALTRPVTRVWPRRLNTFVIAAIVITAPIPLASNHPLAWLFWAAVIGVMGATMTATRSANPGMNTHAKYLFLLGFTFLGWAIFQALPLPGFRGGISVNLPTGPVIFRHLSIAPGATFLASIRLASYLIFFWLALQMSRHPARAKRVGYYIFYGVVAYAVLAVITLYLLNDINFLPEKSAFRGMATGTFVNKNSFATFLGMGLVLGLALILNEPAPTHLRKPKLIRKIPFICLAIILIALVLTQSRMGIGASLIAAGYILHRTRISTRLLPVLLIFTVPIAVALLAVGLNIPFFDLSRSGETRIALYQQVVRLIASRPITGFGIDSFPLAFELFHAPGVTAEFVWDKAHSTYLTLWSESGIIFGSIPIIAGIIATRQLGRRSRMHRPGQSLALAGLGAILLVAMHSLVDFSLEIQANTFLFLAIIALGLGPVHSPKGKP